MQLWVLMRSGKSTLANILSGKQLRGTVEVLENMRKKFRYTIRRRSHKGIFLAFQYPLEIPGVNTTKLFKNLT